MPLLRVCLELLAIPLTHSQLKKGVPADRPKGKAKKYIANLGERQQALVTFLDDFKTKLGMYKEAASTIEECMAVLSHCEKVVGAARVPMLISSAREARQEDGSVLEYGP